MFLSFTQKIRRNVSNFAGTGALSRHTERLPVTSDVPADRVPPAAVGRSVAAASNTQHASCDLVDIGYVAPDDHFDDGKPTRQQHYEESSWEKQEAFNETGRMVYAISRECLGKTWQL